MQYGVSIAAFVCLDLSKFIAVKMPRHLKAVFFKTVLAKICADVYKYFKQRFAETGKKDGFKA